MARKPEATFINSVHDRLPSRTEPYREKMHNSYRGGTADMWYSGNRDVWIEYKFIPSIPKVVLPGVTPLQEKWLNDRYNEGRSVYVIVGCKEGGVIYSDKAWLKPLPAEMFKSMIKSRSDLAKFIQSVVE